MFGTKYDNEQDLDPSVAWLTSSPRYKERWLKSRGFHTHYTRVPSYYDLPHHVQDKWEAESKV